MDLEGDRKALLRSKVNAIDFGTQEMGEKKKEALHQKVFKDGDFWIAKVPSYLFEEWEQISEAGRDVGVRAPVASVAAEDSQLESGRLLMKSESVESSFPTNYTIQPKKEYLDDASRKRHHPEALCIFSELSHGPSESSFRIEGSLRTFADIKPVLDDTYRLFSTKRVNKKQVKKGSVSLLPQSDTMHHSLLLRKQLSRQPVKSAPKDYTIGRLRASLNEVELRAKLFELFHEKEYWKFGELVEATDQPRKHLRDVLSKISDYHKSGPHMYEFSLNAQFKLHE